MQLKKLKLEVTLHTIFSDCKNLQKSVLTNVNIQKTGKTSLQMFVFFIFDGSFICRCLYILRPSSVPRHSICPPYLEECTLIINNLYLQILHSASESRNIGTAGKLLSLLVSLPNDRLIQTLSYLPIEGSNHSTICRVP